ncbi:MAG: protein-L-isoaspartate(D-aspartate) O-methyltransferase [Candidatus Thermoplasmatota archaeon]|nr:protein-L-isoaspartate(D-aspartate) O-methyltransferase [Candidatus Thermoplasmatota archaeon]
MRSLGSDEAKRARLVNDLKEEGIIRSRKVKDAMLAVNRELFMDIPLKTCAYLDRPLPIGSGQTISAPHMVAIMAEELLCKEGNRVLEIGSGSGYHAAVVSHLVGPEGHVYSIERVHELAMCAERNIDEAGIGNITIIEGDGSLGYPEKAPYDRIYYTCAAPEIPDRVMDQLADGGILLGVVGPSGGVQRLIRYTKEGERVKEERLTRCVFVPLIGELGY